jgi:hypothetical protein
MAEQNADDGGQTNRERILRHLIEVATKWEVRVVGRDGDGEMLKVASGRDAVTAASLLVGYDFGPPDKADNPGLLNVAEFFRKVERDRVDLVLAILGDRAKGMEPAQLAEFFAKCQANPNGYLAAAQEYLAQKEQEKELEKELGTTPPALAEPQP